MTFQKILINWTRTAQFCPTQVSPPLHHLKVGHRRTGISWLFAFRFIPLICISFHAEPHHRVHTWQEGELSRHPGSSFHSVSVWFCISEILIKHGGGGGVIAHWIINWPVKGNLEISQMRKLLNQIQIFYEIIWIFLEQINSVAVLK